MPVHRVAKSDDISDELRRISREAAEVVVGIHPNGDEWEIVTYPQFDLVWEQRSAGSFVAAVPRNAHAVALADITSRGWTLRGFGRDQERADWEIWLATSAEVAL